MADENNPTMYIEYGDSLDSLLNYAMEVTVRNSGIFKTPECTLQLKNTDGKYTGNGTLTLALWKRLRIRADVRETIDTLFDGKIWNLQSKIDDKKREILTVTARGQSQKMLMDTITKKYLDEQNEGVADRTMKQVIDHFLANPDSGENTGLTLVTDSGAITTTKAKHNFDRAALLDAIKQICEYIGYGGYEEGTNICLYPYGWQAATPAITVSEETDNNGNQVLEREYNLSRDELYNHICVWAPPQIAYPDRDRFTEGAVAKGFWTTDANHITDDTEIVKVNQKSVKFWMDGFQGGKPSATLDMSSIFPSGLDPKDKNLQTIVFWWWIDVQGINYGCPAIYLEDINGKKIYYVVGGYANGHPTNQWRQYKISLGNPTIDGNYERPMIHDSATNNMWQKIDDDFNWKIKKIRFYTETITVRIDGLHFEGSVPINPITDPTLAATDPSSIENYGRSILHYDEPAIQDYASIYELAAKILETTKNPVKKLKVKVGAKTWIKPNQYATINMPCYGISNEQWRFVEMEYNWKTSTKLLRSTMWLTPRTQPVTSREWYAAQLEGILKNMGW